MKVTYIKHSCFVIEWDDCIWIFDYWKGGLPKMDGKKKIFVFGSHSHDDHFNPDIVKNLKDYPQVEYILSDDIRFREQNKITRLAPGDCYEMEDGAGNSIVVRTFASTDCGVAFLVAYQSQNIFHAGDLNCWVWKEDDEEANRVMEDRYQKILALIKEAVPAIDVAFFPLDPRQEEWYAKGMDGFMEQLDVKVVFPMHFWMKHGIIEQLKASEEAENYADRVMNIQEEGQSFEIG